mmetsp:Transcript_32406/g.51830  ORF Transcript_32406/g.51830 Transcript_32406/m.51830 type:complete len:107 (+) Transcript_32406:212-532(+)
MNVSMATSTCHNSARSNLSTESCGELVIDWVILRGTFFVMSSLPVYISNSRKQLISAEAGVFWRRHFGASPGQDFENAARILLVRIEDASLFFRARSQIQNPLEHT